MYGNTWKIRGQRAELSTTAIDRQKNWIHLKLNLVKGTYLLLRQFYGVVKNSPRDRFITGRSGQ